MKKKLIEVALPLDAINVASAREKSIRHGHPSTLHLWWARRPLAAARAVIFSSLVDDPSSHPDKFPTEEAQDKERKRLFKILEDLVIWENSNDERILAQAKEEILRSTDGNPPEFLDPFAGGGAIPLEAQRLGLKVHASDLNPVAVMINKAMIEIPPKFQGQRPVNPNYTELDGKNTGGHYGLAADVEYYGNWMREEAFKRIGRLYPTVKLSDGSEATVIAWIWARTVKCPNPVCGCEMPLVRSFTLTKKKGKETHVALDIKGNQIQYFVEPGMTKSIEGTVNRNGAQCPCCSTPVGFPYIRESGKTVGLGAQMIAVVAEGTTGRLYLTPSELQENSAILERPHDYPNASITFNPRDFKTPNYGLAEFADLFTPRQLTALTTFSTLVKEAQHQAHLDAIKAGMPDDNIGLDAGGSGAMAYGEAVGIYLAFLVDKLADLGNSLNRWEPNAECPRQLFARQAIPMVWDFAEGNPFSQSSGSWAVLLNNLRRSLLAPSFNFPRTLIGRSFQYDATQDNSLRNIMICTDPPYYDNIGYADLSDFFYVWMRQTLKSTYPQLFRTMLVPKAEELVATPYRFAGNSAKAKDFFESGMLETFKRIHTYTREDIPVTVFYAFKQSETESFGGISGDDVSTSSTGWETMLSALIEAGFAITGTWPIRTEMSSRAVAQGTNALASSIVLVCRKRSHSNDTMSRRDFLSILHREMKDALKKLQQANIAPVDLAQASIGPGIAIFSRNGKIIEADGTPMTVRAALEQINREIDLYFNEQEGDLDPESRFCVDFFSQSAYNPMKYGQAETLASAKGVAIPSLVHKGVLSAEKGNVQLFERAELKDFSPLNASCVWLVTQQMTYAFEQDGIEGAAQILRKLDSSIAENAKALAYRLYTVSERKGWAAEAFAYNSLVTTWPDIQLAATQTKSEFRPGELQFD